MLPKELNIANLPYCDIVRFTPKLRSPNVHILFKVKFVVIEAIIPITFGMQIP